MKFLNVAQTNMNLDRNKSTDRDQNMLTIHILKDIRMKIVMK